jgi:hypothetical protein
MKKIFDPLKLFVFGAIVAALIVLGFQLGKETDKGLVTYLKQENASLRTELDRTATELASLQAQHAKAMAEIAAGQPPAPAGTEQIEAGAAEMPAEAETSQAAAPMSQITDTFDAPEEQEGMEPPTRDAIPQSGN